MGSIDLDAARAARAEAQGDGHSFTFGGEDFDLPAEIPADFAFDLYAGELRPAIESILGDDAARFWAQSPSVNDLEVLVEGIAVLYGFEDSGNSSPSGLSSLNGGKPSRATLRGSTKSTSAKRGQAS